MRVVNMTLEPIFRAIASLMLLIAMVVHVSAQEAPKKNQENTQTSEQSKKKEKKHSKRKAKHADRDVSSQLRDGELSAVGLAQALNVGAGRIGATIDRPTSSGIAVIKELQKMPRKKLTAEIIPALEKQQISRPPVRAPRGRTPE